jgi:lipopolysaccharide/colanic/teichoic acid biosynthesis glycosyltransferase
MEKIEEKIVWKTYPDMDLLRPVDVVVSLIAIIVSLPVMAVIALIIKIDSPGPAIFKQIRVGKDRRRNGHQISGNSQNPNPQRRTEDLGGRPFTFYKFRTMQVDAKEKFPELYHYEYSVDEIKSLYFKIPEDPRLTRFGRRLRKTTLDEFPNFINVLKGDMSLIGPRPDIPEMVKYYEDRQKIKFQVKPGVTGLAQVNGRGLLSFQETLKLDLEYVENNSWWMNVKVLLKTIKVSIQRIGAF